MTCQHQEFDGLAEMPDDLIDVVSGFPADTRELILSSWQALNAHGQERYRRYLDKAWTRSGRQIRCVRAATELIGAPRDRAAAVVSRPATRHSRSYPLMRRRLTP